MNSLRVLVLVHWDCVPPKGATVERADWANWKTEFYVKRALKSLGHESLFHGVSGDLDDLKSTIDNYSPDIVFNLLEEFQGEPGFDAHVVSLLELMGVPYTGCNPQGLAIGRDKSLSKKVLEYHRIKTPGFFTVERGKKAIRPKSLNFPLIVKSLSEEASLGISQQSIVENEEQLSKRVQFIHNKIRTDALIEEYIEGEEYYVAVLGNKKITVFPPWHLSFGELKRSAWPIATRKVKFNRTYCERHGINRGMAKNLTPLQKRQIDKLCRQVFKALKFSGYARFDLRITRGGEIYFIEANPNAELAKGECLANAARHDGVSYAQLIGKILSLGRTYSLVA